MAVLLYLNAITDIFRNVFRIHEFILFPDKSNLKITR